MPHKNSLSPSVGPGQDRRSPRQRIQGGAQTNAPAGIEESKIRRLSQEEQRRRELEEMADTELYALAEELGIDDAQQHAREELIEAVLAAESL